MMWYRLVFSWKGSNGGVTFRNTSRCAVWGRPDFKWSIKASPTSLVRGNLNGMSVFAWVISIVDSAQRRWSGFRVRISPARNPNWQASKRMA
jgi:hypothetical protein